MCRGLDPFVLETREYAEAQDRLHPAGSGRSSALKWRLGARIQTRMLTCTRCGTENPEASRFCNQCGERIDGEPARARVARSYTPRHLVEQVLRTRAALQGERKRVTVLFADIRGSTQLATQAGEEAWHGILDRYFSVLGNAVHRYEGTINQYTGDGIMALFGAPIAHEDHAQRACHAALEMQRDLRIYANELRMTSGLNLTMRIGLNTGDVIVGSIGDDLRMDYTAQGLTVNLAARMEQLCEPGHIYCTRTTAALVEGYFELREIGATAVHGAALPVRVYEVEAAGPLRTRLDRSLARGAARFIGREPELQKLRDALERARSGEGNILAVSGGAGVGKSRLCHEFTIEAERRGIPVHRATGVPYASALPLHPILMLTRSRLGISQAASAAEIRRMTAGGLMLFDPQATPLLPQLLDFLGADDGSGRPGPGTPDRTSLQRLLARFLPLAEGPQILLVEDLHFADAGTEVMLDLLCANVARSQTLVLLNFRPEYEGRWLDRLPHERVPLAALDATQIETLAGELLGPDESVVPLVREIGHRAAGNPFYVEEAIEALMEGGHLDGARGRYRLLQAVEDWPIPDNVQALVAARIDRLDDAEKSLLQTAAVMGQDFDCATLARLVALDIEDCRIALDVLTHKGFVVAAGSRQDQHSFSHPLMQEVAYRSQLERARMSIHARLAELLEQSLAPGCEPTEVAVTIAHHWQHAGEWQKAARWNLEAALWRSTQDAPTTHQQYQLALEHSRRAPPSPEVDHLRVMALCGLLRLSGFINASVDEADRVYYEARSLAELHNDTAGLAEAMICWAIEQLHRGDASEAMQVTAEFVDRAMSAGAPELVRRYRLMLLLACATAGEPLAGVRLIARVDGDDWYKAPIDDGNYLSRGFYSLVQAWNGQLHEALETLNEALAYGERQQRAVSWMYAFRVDFALLSGNHAGVLAQAQTALQLAENYGSDYFRAVALRALGLAHVLQGDAAAAIPLLEKLHPLIAKGGSAHQFEAHSLGVMARAYAGAGQCTKAFEVALQAIESGQRSGSRLWEITAWLALLEIRSKGPWTEYIERGLPHFEELIVATGAESARPWLWLARERFASSDAEREHCRQQALDCFARIGAEGHRRRYAGVSA